MESGSISVGYQLVVTVLNKIGGERIIDGAEALITSSLVKFGGRNVMESCNMAKETREKKEDGALQGGESKEL